ncbi:MAG: hypothetical protein M1823_007628, partial [Watsoniomyces obsoletus]
MGTPQGNMLASDAIGNLDIDDYLRQAEVETRKMQIHNQQYPLQPTSQSQMLFGQGSPSQGQRLSNASSVVNSPAPSMRKEHPYTIHEAQQIAHMNARMNTQVQPRYETTPSSMSDDPAWSQAPDMSDPVMNLDDEQEDEDW